MENTIPNSQRRHLASAFFERTIVGCLFGVFVAHLLLYVWLVPPWQHYDEPTHFEYAMLIRELGRLPTLEEQIPDLRSRIAASMIEHGFFQQADLGLTAPRIDDPNLSLGINERGHPPLYYAIVALGTLPFRFWSIEGQLYAARCVSVAIAALLFVAAYAVLRLLTDLRQDLRLAILAVLALQPAFIDNLSSVNSDVLANTVAVVMLLVGVLVIRRPRWQMVVLSFVIVALAWSVKRTLLVYSLVIPLAWLLATPWAVRRWLLGGAALGALLALCWLFVTPWVLADWRGAQARSNNAYYGAHTFMLDHGAAIEQTVYSYRLLELESQPLTLAAWMRADRPIQATSPVLLIGGQAYSRSVVLDTTWQLITVTAQFPKGHAVEVRLEGGQSGSTIYADELALVSGETLPVPGELDGSFEAGLFSAEPPRNMLRNAGAERRVPTMPDAFVQRFGEAGLAQILSTMFNPRWIAAVYPRQFWLLFVGAWGVFGWGQYTVNPGWFVPLALLVAASCFGALRLAFERTTHETWRVRAWWLCGFAVLLGWGIALLRVHNQPFPGAMFWSFGRYTFVAMLPSLAIFVVGLRAVVPAPLRSQITAAQLAFLVLFALVALTVFL